MDRTRTPVIIYVGVGISKRGQDRLEGRGGRGVTAPPPRVCRLEKLPFSWKFSKSEQFRFLLLYFFTVGNCAIDIRPRPSPIQMNTFGTALNGVSYYYGKVRRLHRCFGPGQLV